MERIDFFDKDGRSGARGNKAIRIKLTFEDGEYVDLLRREFEMLKGLNFTLKAPRDDG